MFGNKDLINKEMLYISSKLKIEQKVFCNYFVFILKQENILFSELKNTNDIWCKDFMPVQVDDNSFVQFVYNPSYLKGKEETITDAKPITSKLGIKCFESDIIMDGGNIIKNNEYAFVTDKIFKENPTIKKDELIEKLTQQLKVKKLIAVPIQPYDDIGHTDGMVRFINDSSIVINDYSKLESKSYVEKFEKTFKNIGLTIYKSPYYHTNEKTDGIYSAEGCYINFIDLNDKILLPQFGNSIMDKKALDFYVGIFKRKKVIPIQCKEIARKGGVLNCISWLHNKKNY